jgi:hypothetical protein
MLILCPNGSDCTDETVGTPWWRRVGRALVGELRPRTTRRPHLERTLSDLRELEATQLTSEPRPKSLLVEELP